MPAAASHFTPMRKCTVGFLISAIVVGTIGFGLMASTEAEAAALAAKICFALSLILLLLSLVYDPGARNSEI